MATATDFDAWQQGVLRPRVRMQLLLMRVVRLDTRRRDRVQARVIVVDDADLATRVRKRLESGADFSLTALQESVDPTAQAGGELPAVARGDLTLPNVEAALFAAQPGDLIGPLAVTIAGREQFHLYKVIDAPRPVDRDPRRAPRAAGEGPRGDEDRARRVRAVAVADASRLPDAGLRPGRPARRPPVARQLGSVSKPGRSQAGFRNRG